MEPLFTEWSEFLQSLTRHRVRFVLVGGHAIAVHARPRHTEDLDVFVEPSPANARVRVPLAQGSVFVIGRRELVANKTAAGRPKDLADLAMLAEAGPRRPLVKRAPARKGKIGR